MAWYEDWFDRDEYELLYQSRDASEAVRLADLVEQIAAPPPGCSILDIGCGRGRHALEFASRGYEITGVDLSERSIAQARLRASEAGLHIDFRIGDMRDPITDRRFDGVINLFTAFGYFDSWDEHARALGAMCKALKSGGFFVQDFLNADRVRADLIPYDERHIGTAHVSQKRWIENNRIRKEITFSNGDESHVFNESVALLRYEDFEALYEKIGFTLFDVYGSYDGDAFTSDSPRMILFSRKSNDQPIA